MKQVGYNGVQTISFLASTDVVRVAWIQILDVWKNWPNGFVDVRITCRKREDAVAVTGDRRITKLEGRGQNPAICPEYWGGRVPKPDRRLYIYFVRNNKIIKKKKLFRFAFRSDRTTTDEELPYILRTPSRTTVIIVRSKAFKRWIPFRAKRQPATGNR